MHWGTAIIAFGLGVFATILTFLWALNDGGLRDPFDPWGGEE